MYQLTWIDSAGYLFAVTAPAQRPLWNLCYHLRRSGTVRVRLWNEKGKMVVG